MIGFMMKTFGVVGLVLALVFLLALGPFLAIWSLNTLFPSLAIAYGLETWFAMFLLMVLLRPDVKVTKK
jgi:hypothetical protein